MTSLPQVQNQPKPANHMTPFSAPWLASLRRAMGTESGRPVLMGGMVPTEPQRRQIAAEISRLQGLLSPSGRATMAEELGRLTTAFPPIDGQADVPAALRAQAYFEALASIPAWAIAEARGVIFRGEAPDVSPRFAPTPPEFRRVCDAVLRPIRSDLADLIAIREASEKREPSKAERERVSRGLANLAAELGGRRPAASAKTLAEASLSHRLEEMGVDPSALDAIPDAPKRSGIFRRAKAPV